MIVEGKVALVTGAAGEIGAAIAQQMVLGGARVALVDRSVEGLREVAGRIGKAASWHECDVSDEASMEQAVAAAEAAHEPAMALPGGVLPYRMQGRAAFG